MSKRSNKTEHIGTALAKAMKELVAKKVEERKEQGVNMWINRSAKDGSDNLDPVSRDLDFNAIDDSWDDSYFMNLWVDMSNIETADRDDTIHELAEDLAGKFLDSDYILGLEFPYQSKNPDVASYGILRKK